ncbi:fumarylacetoacetate hydrolase family protein [Anianabacter salinae]|uniref:fumarylacetoacetate hydrolase family protein n=1 Tax=Anianabacter salinae TaxID=2851023 RepID=UPI00225E0B8C|nr:fumarylacetoacetate hydrolase family protein [Anianabacter salinae]MBV0911113.1 fumarylacetoacetate hydrolase family protein [Anianabacter salinae]
MTDYVFPPPAAPALPVAGSDRAYPVRRIFCVGRNYAAHAAEMGYEVDREKPFYFTKSCHALAHSGTVQPYPPGTDNFHFEMELVVALGAPLFQETDRAVAAKAIFGYACGLDMTRRDLQLSEREQKRPWDLGKDAENSAVIAALTPVADFGPIAEQRIWLTQNDETRQDATLSELVWKVDEILCHLSGFYHLGAGDLVMTGTPAGVGPVVPGDRLRGGIDGLDPVTLEIGRAE